ncbi:MAG: NUDIX hydrolase [Actinomycetota bacterium]|nr:NUDIX hydrolase [Actinomycetota bacterium]
MSFEKIGSEEIWSGKIATVRVDRVRFDDGEEAEREVVAHPGAVGIVAHDGDRLYLVRQPREAVGAQSLLELPAGKLESDGPLETAKRELAEEIGKGANEWEHLTSFWSSPGFADEEVHLYVATGLFDHSEVSDEDERIEVLAVGLDELDGVIRDCRDAKTLVGLLWFRAFVDA